MLTVNANGTSIPQVALGTWPMKGAECHNAVLAALDVGYRHIDTAQLYENEREVGAAIAESPVDRDNIFITTKIWPDNFRRDDFAAAVQRSLEALRTDAVDLLLLHWPSREVPLAETVEALNEARENGFAKAIGISNFTSRLIEEAVGLSTHPLSLNQVEYHPFLSQSAVMAACKRYGLAMTAYCPIAKGKVAETPVIQEIAAKLGRTPTQVALRWLIQQDVIAAPKSATPSRIAENFDVETFALDDADMVAISGLADPNGRIVSVAGLSPDWDA